MKLSNITCSNAKYDPTEKPNGKKHKLMDGGGLFLHIKPNGKYWRFKYRFNQKQKLLSFGVYPEVSLKDAREKRDTARKQLSAGYDPGAVKKEEKQFAILNLENTFEVIAKEWHNNNLAKWNEEHAYRVWRRLEMNIFPALGKKPISEIKPFELLATLKVMEKRGATDLSRRTLQSCSAVFKYAIITGRAEYNPAADLQGALQAHKATHFPAIEAKELTRFYRRLEQVQAIPINKLAIKLLLLTFLRQGELRQGQWEHIDFEAKEWRIPAHMMKARELHIVPLSNQVISLLKEIHAISGDGKYLFPNQHRRVHPVMSENTINNIIKKMGYNGEMVGHGVRTIASTTLNEHGFNRDHIERQLAHSERDKVRGAYNQAQYLPERKKMMQWWADYLERAEKGGANVIEGKFGNIQQECLV